MTLNGKTKHFSVHRLVVKAFINHKYNETVVKRIDGNNYNDCVENLIWISKVDLLENNIFLEEQIKKICIENNLEFLHIQNNYKDKIKVVFICNNHKNKGKQYKYIDHFKTIKCKCTYCTGQGLTTQDLITNNNVRKNIKIIGEYKNWKTPIECLCNICGTKWNPKPNKLKIGQGYPICNSSFGENKIKDFLNKFEIKYITQHTFENCLYISKLRFDFYLPDKDICIEYQG